DVDRGWCIETGPRLPNGDCPKTQIHTIISDDWARATSSDESPLLAKGPPPALTFVTVYKNTKFISNSTLRDLNEILILRVFRNSTTGFDCNCVTNDIGTYIESLSLSVYMIVVLVQRYETKTLYEMQMESNRRKYRNTLKMEADNKKIVSDIFTRS
ncbi:hypothetical protein V1478_002524, partial [Vespula squamosa]